MQMHHLSTSLENSRIQAISQFPTDPMYTLSPQQAAVVSETAEQSNLFGTWKTVGLPPVQACTWLSELLAAVCLI